VNKNQGAWLLIEHRIGCRQKPGNQRYMTRDGIVRSVPKFSYLAGASCCAHADQADISRQSLRLFRPRGLSTAPLSRTGKPKFWQFFSPSQLKIFSNLPGKAIAAMSVYLLETGICNRIDCRLTDENF